MRDLRRLRKKIACTRLSPRECSSLSVATATDLAEFIGAALALNLLFGIPLFPAGLLTGVGVFGILALQRRGFRPLEAVISALIGVIVLGFAFQMFYAQPEADRILAGLFTPQFAGTESVLTGESRRGR